ncbi:hypothetical protein F0562_026342 [Nyssa sinensis]|uniref:SHSP domain-containing protein n=1 Tax=Nyssa sinensis TaxID=561372 RepID=A0A5J5BAZ8_9ASTE|nr:hypothetical protein F0562_026342 [Nyssa sinensis]
MVITNYWRQKPNELSFRLGPVAGEPKSSILQFVSRPLDPFESFSFHGTLANVPSWASETSGLANTRIDWAENSEAHIFKADLPGLKKDEMKVRGGRGWSPPNQRRKEQRKRGKERQVAPRGAE